MSGAAGWVGMAAVMALAMAGRGVGLGKRSLWVDEAFSIWLAQQPLAALISWVATVDQHPPLFYLLLAFWGRVWGWSEAAARSLSVLLSLVAWPFAVDLTGRVTGRPRRWLPFIIFALAPLHVRYAREARMYALLLLSSTVLLWAAVRLVQEGDRSRRKVWAGLLALSALGAVYTHYLAWFTVIAVGGVLALWAASPEGRPARKLLVGAAGVFSALWAPWAPVFVHQAAEVVRRFWIPAPTFGSVVALVHAFNAAYTAWDPATATFDGILLAMAGWAAARLWRRPETRWPAALLVSAAVGPIVASLAVSAVRPIFQVRAVIAASVPYLALVCVGLSRLPRRAVRYGLAVLWVGLSLWGIRAIHGMAEPEPWRDVAAFVAERVQPGDVLLFHATWVQLPFDYYFRRQGKPVAEHGVPVDLFERGELEPLMRPEDVPALARLISGYKRVWLIYSHDWYTDPQGLVLATLKARLCLRRAWQWPNIRVFLFEPCSEG